MVKQNHHTAWVNGLCHYLTISGATWIKRLNIPHAAIAAASAELPIRLIKPDEFAAFHKRPAIRISPTTIRVARKKNGMRLSIILGAIAFTAGPGAFRRVPPSAYPTTPADGSSSLSG